MIRLDKLPHSHWLNLRKPLRFIAIIILLFCVSISASSKNLTGPNDSADVIDNKKIIEMTKSGLGADVIISFINSSATNFDCGMSAIIALKKDSVAEKVLVELMKRCSSQQNTEKRIANTNNPLEKHESGIYYYQKNGTPSEFELKKLYTTVISGQSAGGFGAAIAQGATYGLAKSSIKSELSGSTANVKLSQIGEFYFYFDASTVETNNMNAWWFRTATSPNEFSLIKLKPKGKVREFKMGTSNAYTAKTGIDEDQKISFKFEETSPGIFKVLTTKPLPPGEYCFIYSSAIPSSYTNDKVFDFSIIK
jgi:hypothetical protein